MQISLTVIGLGMSVLIANLDAVVKRRQIAHALDRQPRRHVSTSLA
ncbi:MAG: hypothetical protein ACREBC_27920 [Pyrinomonadaceae bacterium]